MLRGPLFLASAAFLVCAIADLFGIASVSAEVSGHFAGATSGLIREIIFEAGELLISGSLAWVAIILGRAE